ncbi:hypothetical protein M0802_010875 [Mischocyttarus mexicanus]|nr:hypothetical protein M0802_010875 [Mischocyttarus mexicanus]
MEVKKKKNKKNKKKKKKTNEGTNEYEGGIETGGGVSGGSGVRGRRYTYLYLVQSINERTMRNKRLDINSVNCKAGLVPKKKESERDMYSKTSKSISSSSSSSSNSSSSTDVG